MAGLGGLLYGIDVGVIAGALPYLEATSGLGPGRISMIVAAVLLGSVIATLFAGLLADWLGRKTVLIISGALFVASIPIIAMSHGYTPLLLGRLLQGGSAGLIGVAGPLYLAECLTPANRGRGTAVFQWMLTLGIVASAIIAMYFSARVAQVAALHDAASLLAFKNVAWRSIFWITLIPGAMFMAGCFFVTESPRWLVNKGRLDRARAALLKSRRPADADLELAEMRALARHARPARGSQPLPAKRESLLKRRYVIPFILACVILACNQATGINSIIGYNTAILIQAGLNDVQAHWGYLIFTMLNFLMTMAGVMLVDKIGRKKLLSIGCAGIVVSLLCTAILFQQAQRGRIDCRRAVAALVSPDQSLNLRFTSALASKWQQQRGGTHETKVNRPDTFTIIYSYGAFTGTTNTVRSGGDRISKVKITRAASIPANRVIAFFQNPLASLALARTAKLKIDHAWLTPIPSRFHGVLTALALLVFIAFYAAGPGVCVWLALSELMPTRIRSSGMSIALLINQSVSTLIAALFLPTVGRYGYAMAFFIFAGCTVVYFLTAAFMLPETKHKTLEEIEELFRQGR